MDAFKAQQQIRNNAKEYSDCLSDLKSWGKDMDNKEKISKQKKDKKTRNQNNVPPIRNQAKATADFKENDQRAAKYKSEGNDYFKAKKYASAIESYTKAIQCTPYNAVLYSNRSQAKLRMKQFKSAELDCNKAIDLDSTQIKAWFRRGLARKSLKKYKKALQDFETVLTTDPNNKAAKKEKIEMKNKLDAMYKKSKMRRIVIEECDDTDSVSSSDEKETVHVDVDMDVQKEKEVEEEEEVKHDMIHTEHQESAFEMGKLPTNFIEFEKMWSRARIEKYRALILLRLKNKRIDKIIKNMMDDTLFSEMIQTIYYIVIEIDIKDGFIILKQLIKLDRFEMIVMFLKETDRKLLKEIEEKCNHNKLDLSVFRKFE